MDGERQCKAFSKTTGERCQKKAWKDEDLCFGHRRARGCVLYSDPSVPVIRLSLTLDKLRRQIPEWRRAMDAGYLSSTQIHGLLGEIAENVQAVRDGIEAELKGLPSPPHN